jgi:hypothetical protein
MSFVVKRVYRLDQGKLEDKVSAKKKLKKPPQDNKQTKEVFFCIGRQFLFVPTS